MQKSLNHENTQRPASSEQGNKTTKARRARNKNKTKKKELTKGEEKATKIQDKIYFTENTEVLISLCLERIK